VLSHIKNVIAKTDDVISLILIPTEKTNRYTDINVTHDDSDTRNALTRVFYDDDVNVTLPQAYTDTLI
jgi:hypothetical protein